MTDENQSPNRTERAYRWIEKHPLLTILLAAVIIFVMVVIYWAIGANSSPVWTGFGAYDEETAGPRAKTLWDWMGLLIVPLAVAIGAAVISYFQKRTELDIAAKARAEDRDIAEQARINEQKIASDRQMQTTLEAYYDRMTALLLENNLRKAEANEEVRSIARARTMSVVKSLDAERNQLLFTFLKASKLIEKEMPIVDLRATDLSQADLRGIDLSGCDLSKADLSDANLSEANLSWANLSGANLSKAFLTDADLFSADLSRANLSTTHLVGTNLGNAILSLADLRGAKINYLTWIEQKWDLVWSILNEYADLRNLSESDLSEAFLVEVNLSKHSLKEANLSRSDLSLANLSEVDLEDANLQEATLYRTDLKGANLNGTNLDGTDLGVADLTGAKNWNTEQFDEVKALDDATMPDGTCLKGINNPNAPTYEEWKAQYLAKQGSG